MTSWIGFVSSENTYHLKQGRKKIICSIEKMLFLLLLLVINDYYIIGKYIKAYNRK